MRTEKKKILLHFKSDKFLRVFHNSQLKKELEKKYEIFFLMGDGSRFRHIISKKKTLIYQKGLNSKFILKYPIKFLIYIIYRIIDILLLKNINFESVTYRHNLIKKIGFQYIKKKNKNIKFDFKKEYYSGNFLNPIYGFPFPENKFLFKIFKGIFLSKYFIHPGFYDLLKKKKFSAIIYFHLQNKEVFFIKNAAKFLGYKQINIIYGWDQPTLKGCVAANKDEKIITTNKQLKLDLKQFHNFPNSNLINLGNFFLEDFLKKRKKFKSKKIVIFYALNTIRGAENEIEVIKNIINFFVRQKIKYKLVLRPHPHDRYYFKEILKFKNSHIEIMKSTFFDINKLIEKLNESDLVLTNGTSMFLDARALNKQCASLILDKSDLNLQKPHLRFFSKKQHNLIYNNFREIYKDYKKGILRKKNFLLDNHYVLPLNKNITNQYMQFIENELQK